MPMRGLDRIQERVSGGRSEKSDVLLFLRGWLQAPRMVGAVAPSSRLLCEAMAAGVDPRAPGVVIELGPGTGQVTKALLERGLPPSNLLAIERNPDFVAFLAERFPEVAVVVGDAAEIEDHWREQDGREVAAIVSGVPLLSVPRAVRDRIVRQSMKLLAPGRPFLQFTYGLWSPIDRGAFGLVGRPVARVLRNVPPASVWRYERPATPDLTC